MVNPRKYGMVSLNFPSADFLRAGLSPYRSFFGMVLARNNRLKARRPKATRLPFGITANKPTLFNQGASRLTNPIVAQACFFAQRVKAGPSRVFGVRVRQIGDPNFYFGAGKLMQSVSNSYWQFYKYVAIIAIAFGGIGPIVAHRF